MIYEWDETKRVINLQKHGIDFIQADLVMESPDALRFYARTVNDEARCGAMAEVTGHVLQLIYTMRDDTVRCISFRKAKRKERNRYYAYLQQRRSQENA